MRPDGFTEFTDDGLEALARLHELRSLELNDLVSFTDEGFAELRRLPHLHTLHLFLMRPSIESPTRLLSAAASFEPLRELILSYHEFPTTALPALAQLQQLEKLSIYTPEGEVAPGLCATLARLPNLREMALGTCNFSESDISMLRRNMPNTRIVIDQ